MILLDLALGHRVHRERHREIGLAGARGPDPEGDRAAADRLHVALLIHRLRGDLLAPVTPDHVLEDVPKVAGLVERGQDRVDGAGSDRMAARHELGQLVDHEAGFPDLVLLTLERQLVPAQENREPETVTQRSEDAVVDGCELGGDLVGD